MCPGFRIDKLTRDTNAFSGFAHATFEYIAHSKFAADLLHIYGPALVGEARITCDYEQPAKTRQRHRDVLDDTIGEILLLWVGTEVLEGQHGNRGLAGKRHGGRWS